MKTPKSLTFGSLMLMLFAVLMLTCASCSPTMYWGTYKQTASGKHYKLKPAWGNHAGCTAMHHGQYVKQSTVRRQRFH